jgi:hypothetical protein
VYASSTLSNVSNADAFTTGSRANRDRTKRPSFVVVFVRPERRLLEAASRRAPFVRGGAHASARPERKPAGRRDDRVVLVRAYDLRELQRHDHQRGEYAPDGGDSALRGDRLEGLPDAGEREEAPVQRVADVAYRGVHFVLQVVKQLARDEEHAEKLHRHGSDSVADLCCFL